MLEVVKRGSDNLRYASEELRGDKDIVMEAIKHSDR